MRLITSDDRKAIVIGKPLPFSVFARDRTLLLAAGQIVPNEFVREGLVRSGVYAVVESDDRSTAQDASRASAGPLADLQADYANSSARRSAGFRMERDGQVLSARVIGVSDDGSGLIMAGPVSSEGVASAIDVGKTWTFRALYARSAVRFNAIIEQVVSAPFRYFYVSQLSEIDTRNVRQWPRTLTSLWASREGEAPRVITDLSVGGARIAVKDRTPLQQGQSLLLNPTLQLAVVAKEMSVGATVVNVYGRTDPKHTQIEFYGVQFDKPHESQQLILHAYVQEHLCLELDRVWQVLAIPAATSR